VNQGFAFALVMAAGFAAVTPSIHAQAPPSNRPAGTGQNSQPSQAQQPAPAPTQTNANPFPEDTSSVPVMPTGSAPDIPTSNGSSASSRVYLPDDDFDPVRSPEDAGQAAESQESSSSSSLTGMGNLVPDPDDEAQPGKHNKKGAQIEPEHHETAAEDENVGSYYLDSKNWRAALSRFQSALVLDPDNPDVYWGLAESERHLSNFAEARANYQKVVAYDPDGRHGKDARKALKDPEIANAKSTAQTAAPASQ
jgi:hypothetical protein